MVSFHNQHLLKREMDTEMPRQTFTYCGCSGIRNCCSFKLQESLGVCRIICHSINSAVSKVNHSFVRRKLSKYGILKVHGRDIQGLHILTAAAETLRFGILAPENPWPWPISPHFLFPAEKWVARWWGAVTYTYMPASFLVGNLLA